MNDFENKYDWGILIGAAYHGIKFRILNFINIKYENLNMI